MPRIVPAELGRVIAVAAISLGVATPVVALLEATIGVPDASSIYIVAVVATAFLVGTAGAVAAAIGAFLLYNYLFTDPVGTFLVAKR